MEFKKYPDTLAGAVACLREESTLVLADEPTGQPDPQVEGVWLVNLDEDANDGNNAAIVYLGGYADPWGNLREDNDFEVGTR